MTAQTQGCLSQCIFGNFYVVAEFDEHLTRLVIVKHPFPDASFSYVRSDYAALR